MFALSTLPETETMQVVYALSLGGLLKRERMASVFTKETLDAARSAKPAQRDASGAAKDAPQVAETNQSAPPAAAQREEPEEFQVDDLFARLAMAENYYQVLGVTSSVFIQTAFTAMRTRRSTRKSRRRLRA